MLHIPKIDDYLKILTDEELKHLVAIIFSEYFKSTRESTSLRKVAKSFYIFLTTADEVEKYVEIMQSNSSVNCKHRYNVEDLNILIQNYN